MAAHALAERTLLPVLPAHRAFHAFLFMAYNANAGSAVFTHFFTASHRRRFFAASAPGMSAALCSSLFLAPCDDSLYAPSRCCSLRLPRNAGIFYLFALNGSSCILLPAPGADSTAPHNDLVPAANRLHGVFSLTGALRRCLYEIVLRTTPPRINICATQQGGRATMNYGGWRHACGQWQAPPRALA